ncbi:MAG: pirin family protein [Mariprofundaceae bacterium]|nr:pirin family protein [Mariprofundaceae bacterium]
MIRIQQAITVPEGDGVSVKRLMPVHGMRNFDPFVLWDHFDIEPGGFPDHPHRGFEAITYLFTGGMRHKDNLGNEGTVHAGGTQRFTAGRGIVHSEFPDGHASGIQLWINLPKRLKQIEPDYQQLQADDLPEQEENGTVTRTIVGEGSPLRLHTSVQYLDMQLDPGTQTRRNFPSNYRGLIYAVQGSGTVNGQDICAGMAAYFESGTDIVLSSQTGGRFMLAAGIPHGEPIVQHGPFVD